ncbi:TPA: hypothetical protein DIS56_02215 [Candidatus Saccharibacteria bacterium]|nr:MAG: hypothetical protein A3F05_03105 [Candidatus Saccharibacteria bacterium RIFCSPHIGHO2_12_FULL_47_17]HCM51926.1 hypothetical protein [Candidatus Saccharibacteria bacterium]
MTSRTEAYNLEAETSQYGKHLFRLLDERQVPAEVIETVDHMDLMVPEAIFGDFMRKEISPRSLEVAYMTDEPLFVMNAMLKSNIEVFRTYANQWLQVSREEAWKRKKIEPVIDAITFYYPDLKKAKKILKKNTSLHPREVKRDGLDCLSVTLASAVRFEVISIPIYRATELGHRKKINLAQPIVKAQAA